MIQDIYPHILYNSYSLKEEAKDQDVIIFYDAGKILLKIEDGHLLFPVYNETSLDRNELIYLFKIDEVSFFLSFSKNYPQGFTFYSLSEIRKHDPEPREYVYGVYTAYHLSNWYETNRYCGKCGNPNQLDETERAMYCPVCKRKEYPRINPAVIVGIKNKDKLLITKYRNGFSQSALVAGFTEIGETLEETVQREVKEETGLKVKNIRYYKSQPWGTAADILAGFYCEVDGDDMIRMDENELKYASWVKREDIELQDTDYSLTNEMMKRFKEGIE